MREAGLREHELRIAQAKRRLDRAAVRPAGPAPGSGRPPASARPTPPRPGTVPATPAGPAPTRPAPAAKDRRGQVDDELAKLAAERDALAARFVALERQLADLKRRRAFCRTGSSSLRPGGGRVEAPARTAEVRHCGRDRPVPRARLTAPAAVDRARAGGGSGVSGPDQGRVS